MNHLERALDNQNQWWKYPVIAIAGFVASNIVGAITLGLAFLVKKIQNGLVTVPSNLLDFASYGLDPNIGLALIMVPFIAALVTVILLIKPLHKRNIKDVINGTSSIRWNHFAFSFLIWFLILAIVLVIDYMINPSNFVFQLNISLFIPLIILSLLLIPFQSTFEEVLCRGYLAQGVAAWTKNRWLAIFLPALLFGLLHIFNPEIKEFGFWLTMPQYILFGVVFGIMAVLDDGIETAMGAHAANNVFMSIMVTNKASVLQTPAFFEQQNIDPAKELVVLLLASTVFIAVMAYKYKWKLAVINKKVE